MNSTPNTSRTAGHGRHCRRHGEAGRPSRCPEPRSGGHGASRCGNSSPRRVISTRLSLVKTQKPISPGWSASGPSAPALGQGGPSGADLAFAPAGAPAAWWASGPGRQRSDHQPLRNSSTSTPACRKIARSVPSGKSPG